MRRTRTSILILIAALLMAVLPTASAAADELAGSSVMLSVSGTLQEHHPISLQAFVAATGPVDFETDATVAITREGGNGPDCGPSAFSFANGLECAFESLAPGTYAYNALYSGNSVTAGSESGTITFEVLADTVDATAVTRDHATFYPARDSYRDTLTISGARDEAISVSIRIYSPAGSLVKSVSIASGSGAYSYAWNGRTSSGALRAAGRYRIVQTLTDAAGTTRSWTSYTTLSHKKLVTKTRYVTKSGSSLSAVTVTGDHKVSASGGWVKLHGTSADPVGAAWGFTIPKATVYRSISLQAYTNAPLSASSNASGMQDFTLCPYSGTWDLACFDHWASIGKGTGARHWTGNRTTSSHYRSGTHVRGAVYIDFGTVTVYEVRVKVVYAVLR